LKKGNLFFLVTLSVLVLSIGITPVVLGTPSDQANDKAHEAATVTLPENAREVSPGVYSIGYAYHNGELVQGFLIFHHRPGHDGGPPNGGEDPPDDPTDNPCYTFIGDRKQKWKTVEDWVVNTANNGGLDPNLVLGHLDDNFTIWEAAAGKTIVGTGTTTTDTLVADQVQPDGRNEIYFANIIESPTPTGGVIAATFIWMNIIGPPIIVEMDEVYDDFDFGWSFNDVLPADPTKMDFDNIAAHENGHWVGLGHPQPQDPEVCPDETMFFQTSLGETNSRDLNAGDITGIQKLY